MPDVMKTVGRYEILSELGRGGMAKVYLARQTDLDRFVALKELGAFHQDDEAFAQRFLRESRVAGSLSHPNIVTVHDFFSHEGTPYIAMEYVERGSLRPWVGKMTLAQIGGVLEGLLAGLTNAEQNGIVHRDLKPENMMVTAEGRVKIADFGIAKARNQMQTGAFLTATGTTVGTPTYMAPEQAMAQEVGPWTDMYSVGVMAFEMFVGHVPFHDSDAPMAILLRHVNEDIAPAHTVNPNVPIQISQWIQRCLIKDVAQRMPNASTAWDEFEGILIELVGPRWRREARLLGEPGSAGGSVDTPIASPKPLTPAPFEADQGPQTTDGGWGADVPGPATPPPGPGVTPGPDTLEQHFNQPSAPGTPPSQMSVEPTGFITGAAPAPGAPGSAYVGPVDPGATAMPQSVGHGGAVAQPLQVKEKRAGGRNLVPFIVGGAIIAGVGGFGISKAVGGGSADESATAGKPVTPVDGPAVAMTVPAGWSKVASPPQIPGLELEDAVAVAPGGRPDGEGIVVGKIEKPNIASLLPAAFEKQIDGTPKARQPVDLGAAKAFKYTGLKPQNFDREVAVYAIPTGAGSIGVVCFAPTIHAFASACETVAMTTKLTGDDTAVTLGPNPDNAANYKKIFADLNDTVAAKVKAIGSAKPKAQAAPAKAAAKAYSGAAKDLKALEVTEYVDKELVAGMSRALQRVGRGFDQLSSAARAGSNSRYKKAEKAIAAADREVAAAMKRFGAAGYKVGS